MKELIFPNLEERLALNKTLEFSTEEKTYWDELNNRLKEQLVEPEKRASKEYFKEVLDNNYSGLINFYENELQNIPEKIGQRKNVERQIKYWLGYAHEYAAQEVLKDSPSLERSEMFATAAAWYHAADETIGYYTAHAMRQAESCWGVAEFRKDAGLDDAIITEYTNRGSMLINGLLCRPKNNGLIPINPHDQAQLSEFFDKVSIKGAPKELYVLKKIEV